MWALEILLVGRGLSYRDVFQSSSSQYFYSVTNRVESKEYELEGERIMEIVSGRTGKTTCYEPIKFPTDHRRNHW